MDLQTITPELAAKLARRLEAQPGDENAERTNTNGANIPAPPVIPQKIVPNPYVENDESFSVDDFLLNALNKKQEENNNELSATGREPLKVTTSPSDSQSSSLPSSVVQSTSLSPASSLTSPVAPTLPTTNGSTSSPRTPPPKTTIRGLLEKELAQSNATAAGQPTSKVPVMTIEHHKASGQERTNKAAGQESGGDELSELERKLAAQRAKREMQMQQAENLSGNHNTPTASLPQGNLLYSNVDDSSAIPSSTIPVPPPLPKLLQTIEPPKEEPRISPIKESSKEPSEERRVREEEEEKKRFEELEQSIQRALSKSPTSQNAPSPPPAQSIQPPPIPEKTKHILLVDKEILNLIEQKESASIPAAPSVPAKLPESPIAKKLPIGLSPLGLMCDPLLSVEGYQSNVSSPTVKKQLPQIPQPENKRNPEEELSEVLDRRAKILEGDAIPHKINQKLPLYAEFPEFSRKQIKFFTETFKKFDEDADNYIDFMELKRMMEKLGNAQTHIALKQIIQKVDEDQDQKISLREFFLIFRLAAKGELGCSEVFQQLADSVDVTKEGVLGAANFFQAKIEEQTKSSKFEAEIKAEQEERKQKEQEKAESRQRFLESKNLFK
ncbi:hypothetical protein WR25_13467 [Diploscapter pachys]|uniref:EF-hand domain-containing protein n=1 Tax=Diploscapter pachys TaxID=2018661 RepID=A0A2A2KGI0_9BILA|nr:hypothetical protein WR25_13467 [Diploscapter pachys]